MRLPVFRRAPVTSRRSEPIGYPLWQLSARDSFFCSFHFRSLSFHRSSGQPLHNPSLKNENHHRYRGRRDNSGGEYLSPRHLVLPAEQRYRNWNGLPLRAQRERKREEKFVPAINE